MNTEIVEKIEHLVNYTLNDDFNTVIEIYNEEGWAKVQKTIYFYAKIVQNFFHLQKNSHEEINYEQVYKETLREIAEEVAEYFGFVKGERVYVKSTENNEIQHSFEGLILEIKATEKELWLTIEDSDCDCFNIDLNKENLRAIYDID